MRSLTELLVAANRKYGKRLGWQLKRYQADFYTARKHLIALHRPTLAIDGGANEGQWAQEFRMNNEGIPIVSFEPVTGPYLKAKNLKLPHHRVEKLALGSRDCSLHIHISSNSAMSSSLAKPTGHLRAFPQVTFNETQTVQCVRLDSFPEFVKEKVWLKLDLQGFEWEALMGATRLLQSTVGIEIETSLTENYEGERQSHEIIGFLGELGFRPFHIFAPGIAESGAMNYLDILFSRDSERSNV